MRFLREEVFKWRPFARVIPVTGKGSEGGDRWEFGLPTFYIQWQNAEYDFDELGLAFRFGPSMVEVGLRDND